MMLVVELYYFYLFSKIILLYVHKMRRASATSRFLFQLFSLFVFVRYFRNYSGLKRKFFKFSNTVQRVIKYNNSSILYIYHHHVFGTDITSK
jgi:hypothetical protein